MTGPGRAGDNCVEGPDMRAFSAVSLGALGLVSLAGSASAEPTTPDSYAGMPITDPAVTPEVIGVGVDPQAIAALDSPTLLFVNFDVGQVNAGCGNDARNDCSQLYSGPFTAYTGNASERAAVIQAAREDVEDFGVIVVGERPPNDQPYAMVIVGQPAGGSPPGVGGVAPAIDCGNTNPWITSFAFLLSSGANTLATVIHQEAAHTWGLEHVDENTDNLFPSAGGTVDPKYTDACHQIVVNTDLSPDGDARCNSIHTLFCPANQQNSYQEMLALFGAPVPDLVPPTVAISSPAEGAELDYSADFDLTFVLDDDRRPQIFDIVVYFDDVEATDAVLIDQEHTFPVAGGDAPAGHGLFNGPHTIRIEALDEAGNVASDEVTFVIVGGNEAPAGDGSGGDGSGGDAGDGTAGSGGDGTAGGDATAGLDGGRGNDDGGCACATTPPGGGTRAAWWMLAPLLLLRRRRR